MMENILNDCGSSANCCDVYRLPEELKVQQRKIADFSTPVNPLGVSKKVKAELRKHLKYLDDYPDPEAKRLKKRLAQHHGIDPESIICGNGSTELIYLIARALKPHRILIPAPVIPEYERACRTMGQELQVTIFELKKETDFDIQPDEFVSSMRGNMNSSPPFDMVFLSNPNNPTGRLLRREGIRKIAAAAEELRCYLVIDEAFIDFCPDDSVIRKAADNPYLIVLRSMSPFYGLPGLRLGYGVFPKHIIEQLKEYREPWTVNTLAQRAAVIAIKDGAYKKETLMLLSDEKKYLERNFKKMGMKFFPSVVNFYLVKMDDASEISLQLIKNGILICDCSHFRGLGDTYMRIAVKSHRENTILIKELAKIFDRRR